VYAIYELHEGEEAIVHRPGRGKDLTLYLNENSRYWVKAGSVGGPYREGQNAGRQCGRLRLARAVDHYVEDPLQYESVVRSAVIASVLPQSAGHEEIY